MLEDIKLFIEENNMIENKDRILLALSGGPDSIALLHILLELKDIYNLDIGVAHINHNLRGESADGDELFVKKLAENLGLESYTKKVDINTYAKKHNIGQEEAGRKVRYDYFNQISNENAYNKIAVAHNLDDNIETFLFRLMRGTSLDGLSAIPFIRDNIIRPLMCKKKSEILEYLDKNNFEYRIDETNNENIYTRNKIRLDLIPYIEKEFNGNFVDSLSSLINEIKDIKSYLDKDIDKFVLNKRLSISKLEEYPIIIRKRIYNAYMKRHKVEASRKKIEKVEEIVFSNGHKELDLGQNFILIKDYENIYIQKKNKKNGNKSKIALEINKKIRYNGYVIESRLVETLPDSREGFYFDYTKLSKSIYIRTRDVGDRFIPFGMKNSKKLKNFLIDEKIDREKRDELPIIVSGKDILAIANLRSTNLFKVDKDTKKILQLKVKEEKSNGQ